MNKYYLNPDETALLLIDFQEKLIPAIADNASLEKPVKLLLGLAKAFKLPVYVTEQYPKGLGPSLSYIKEGLAGCQHKLWDKTCFSAALPDLLANLEADHIKTIIVAGIEAHICVYQTVRDLLQKSYQIHLATDAVGSRDPRNKENALRLLDQQGAVITNTETIAYDLLKDARHDSFKEIAKLVK